MDYSSSGTIQMGKLFEFSLQFLLYIACVKGYYRGAELAFLTTLNLNHNLFRLNDKIQLLYINKTKSLLDAIIESLPSVQNV